MLDLMNLQDSLSPSSGDKDRSRAERRRSGHHARRRHIPSWWALASIYKGKPLPGRDVDIRMSLIRNAERRDERHTFRPHDDDPCPGEPCADPIPYVDALVEFTDVLTTLDNLGSYFGVPESRRRRIAEPVIDSGHGSLKQPGYIGAARMDFKFEVGESAEKPKPKLRKQRGKTGRRVVIGGVEYVVQGHNIVRIGSNFRFGDPAVLLAGECSKSTIISQQL